MALLPQSSPRATRWRRTATNRENRTATSRQNRENRTATSRHRGFEIRGATYVAKLGELSKISEFLAGSFSAVSKRNFARKYTFDSIFQDLQDLHPFAPLQSQNFRKKISLKKQQFSWNFSKKNCKCRKICKMLSNFKNFSLRIW